MSTERCEDAVYEHGESMGYFDMPKQEAERYCQTETERTGRKHDWHYFAGRVHVLAMPPSKRLP